MDELDSAIEQTLKTADKARVDAVAADPIDDAVSGVISMDKARRQASLRTAVQVNPDEAAQANKLAASRGLPPDVVLRNLPQVKQDDAAERANRIMGLSPALAAKMRDLPFAQVAHDSVESLGEIEKHIRVTGEIRAARGPDPTLGSYLSGVWESVKGRTKQADIGMSMQISDLAEKLGFTPDPVRRAELARRYQQAGSDVGMSTPEFKSDTAKGIYGGVSSTISALPPLALSIISRNPTIGLTAMGLQTESEAYGKYRSRGASAGEALVGGVGEGAVEVLTEKIPMGFVVDKFGKAGAKQFLAGMLLREVPSEQVATILQDAIDTAVANPDKTWGEYLRERPGAAYQTLLATLVQAGTMGGASAAVQKVADRAERKQLQTEQDANALQGLLDLAGKDKLRERDPTAFASMVQAAADQHGVPGAVYIDAGKLVETLAQSGMKPEQIEAALPSTKAQLAEAAAAGGDAIVPIGEFTALVAGSGLEAQLVKHARLSPDALSQEDAKLLAKVDLKAETEKVMAQQEAVAESKVVRDQVFEQLSLAGRFSPSVNEAYADSVAALYETQAARLGVSVAEFAKRYPLNVTGVAGTQQKLDQGEQVYKGAFKDKQGREFGIEINREMLGLNKDTPSVNVSAMFEGGRRGRIDFGVLPDGTLAAENTMVAGIFRGAGIAEGMYRAAREAGFDIAPGRKQTEQGDKMVASLLAKGVINKPRTESLNQDSDPKGTFTPSTNTIALLAKADLSTFHHELGHFYLEVLADMTAQPDAPATVVEDMNKVLEWFGIKGGETVAAEGSKTGELQQGPAEQAQTEAFKKWFGDSKAVDENGKPLVVYHGSARKNPDFRPDRGGGIGGIYFTPSAAEASEHARADGEIDSGSPFVIPAYLSIQNPKIFVDSIESQEFTVDQMRAWEGDGFDGVFGMTGDGRIVEIAAFHPEQIKSVTGNDGTFDANDPSILSQDGSEPAPTEPVTPKATPLDTWRSMTLDQQREFHEKFARGYEAWLFEGKAPSTALARTFQRFSEWMRRIYRSIKALNVELNDDIRRVYDRMLASEEAIKEAETARAYAPLFKDEKTLEEAGVDPASYHELGREATAEAIDRLQARSIRDMRWLSNAKSRALKALQKEAKAARKTVEAQVTAEVDARREFRAAAELKKKTDPLAVVDAFGFDSIEQMEKAIAAAGSRKDVIEGLTDQRMLEEHGELSSPEAIERAAEQAIHNEARGKFIATELAALDKALGPARVLVAAAKQFATAVLGKKKITDIKPHVFTAAETRAAKLAEKLIGKVEEAATAKRNQLLNHYAARYAHDAVGEIERIREFFARVANTPDDRLKSRDMDVVNAARAILAAYGVGRKGEAAAEYLKKVAAYDPEMSQVLQGSVDAALANAKPLAELTLDELRALNDEVASLWHLAKRSRQMEIDGDLLDREEVQDQLKARLDEIGIPDRIPGEGSAVTPAEEKVAKLKTYLASARRTEAWVEAMDGKPTGGFRSFIWQPVKEAADAYRTDKAALLKKYRALLDTIAPTLRKRIVEAPELGYSFGKDTGGVALNEILHALLHTGNSSNKKKLLLGRKWATELPDGSLDTSRWDAFVHRMVDEGVLTKAHFDFVQGVWDLLEETKPLAQKTHRDVFGKYFAEITAEPVATPFGEYRGGYVPAQADPRVVSDAKTRALMEDENASMAFAFPATAKGFTKSRVEYNRPLTLDLGTLAQHLDRVLLFSHMERPIRDVRRVLTSKGVAYGVNRIDPAAFDAIISPWLNRAARQVVTTPSPGHWQSWRLWSTLRNRAGMAAMFGNVVNAAQQITGFSIAAVKVKPKYMLGAMAHYVTNPRQMANDVAEASPYMEGRMRNEVAAMNDQIKDILIDPGLYERTQQWTMRHAYFMQSAVDNVMSPIIWTAARNQALEQGQSEKEATRFADATVRQTQGSTLPEDISNWEAGSSFSRMFSQFAGYFNMQANLLGTEFQTIARDMGLRKGAGRGLYVTLMAFLIPAWTSELIVQAFRGGPEDEDKDGEYLDDWLQAVFGMATLRGAAAMVPIFGQAASAVVNAMNDKPYDDRLATSPAISMIEAAFKSPVSLYKAMFEDGDKSKAVKDVASLISLFTGIPANIAARPASYMVDVAEGDVQPTGPVDAARGAVTGRASPDSKR
jgi:hypothetical protein